MTRTIRAFASAIVATLALAAPAQAQSRVFTCPNNVAVTVTVTGADSISVSPINGEAKPMLQVPGTPNAFANGEFGVQISPDQNRAAFVLPNVGIIPCTFQPGVTAAGRIGLNSVAQVSPEMQQQERVNAAPPPDRFPMPGRSFGGIMRSEPRQDAPRVRSFRENEPFTIIDRGPMWDGYNWFAIRYPGGEGWQWGGIMCSSQPLAGILAQCKN